MFRIHIHRIRIRIQPKNLNPDPDRPWIQILAISLHYLKKNLNYFIIISFYHQKKSIKRKNVVVPKNTPAPGGSGSETLVWTTASAYWCSFFSLDYCNQSFMFLLQPRLLQSIIQVIPIDRTPAIIHSCSCFSLDSWATIFITGSVYSIFGRNLDLYSISPFRQDNNNTTSRSSGIDSYENTIYANF